MKVYDIQNKVHNSQAFISYKSANDEQKEEYYFSHDLNCEKNGQKIDSDSLFCYSLEALKLRKYSDGLKELKYDLHILLVGTSLQPLMLSVSAIDAENIILLYASDGTERKKDRLYEYIKAFKSIDASSYSVNSSEPYTIFSTIKKIVESNEWKNKKICLDITGGKKSMVGGGFLSSSIFGIDTYYIDFHKYQNSSPVICTEFLNKLDNPYDIYNVREETLIQSLWERQDFDAVINIVSQTLEKFTEKIAEDYDLKKDRNRLIQIKNAACCYSKWSKFNYELAFESTNYDYYQKNHQDILSILSPCKELRKSADGAIFLALDRWTRGGDALRLSDFNKSALYFTQAIEVLCEFCLYDMTQRNNVSPQFQIGGIHFEVSSLIKFLWDSKDSTLIIDELEPKKDTIFKWNTICRFSREKKPSSGDLIQKLSIRNKLAHFNCFDEEQNDENKSEIERFQNTVQALIELFIANYQDNDGLCGKSLVDLQTKFLFAKYEAFTITQ